jgi:hypothetical protein
LILIIGNEFFFMLKFNFKNFLITYFSDTLTNHNFARGDRKHILF